MIRSALVAMGCLWLMLVGTAVRAETRVALVIGNGAYQHTARLANPENDARDVASALTAAGFQVFEAFNVEKRRLDGVLRAWADAIAKADVALFYYAGHGVQVGQQNYLLPVDAQLAKERDLEFEGIKVDFILRQMEIDREGKTNIVILDACRDNPLARNLAGSMGTRSAAVGRGLGAAPAGLGMFIAYATQPGNVALDGTGERNSPFAQALVKEMLVKGRNINATMGAVRRAVVEVTRGQQVPWDHSSLTADFFFVPAAGPPPAPALPKDSEELAALKERLKKLEAEAQKRDAAPAGDVARLAELRARAGILDDTLKDMQRKVLDTRMREGRAADLTEKQRLQREAMTLQGDLTRRSLELRRLRDEIAALESSATEKKTGAPPFVVQTDSRIIGTVMPAPPSTANCESRCLIETGCIGWNLSRDGVCELMSAFVRRDTAANWRSGLRTDATASPQPAAAQPAPIPAVTPKATSDATAGDYESRDGVRLAGTEIDTAFRAPNPAACRDACDRNAGCVGYQHGRKVPVSGQCHLFSRIDARAEDDKWRSGVRIKERTAKEAAGAELIALPAEPVETRQGFALFKAMRIEGNSIKLTRETTVEGCITVCRNTPDCIAGMLDAKSQPARCRVFKSVSQASSDGIATPQDPASVFVRTDQFRVAQPENARR